MTVQAKMLQKTLLFPLIESTLHEKHSISGNDTRIIQVLSQNILSLGNFLEIWISELKMRIQKEMVVK